jgi:mono/diheme cytochrome c family protein
VHREFHDQRERAPTPGARARRDGLVLAATAGLAALGGSRALAHPSEAGIVNPDVADRGLQAAVVTAPSGRQARRIASSGCVALIAVVVSACGGSGGASTIESTASTPPPAGTTRAAGKTGFEANGAACHTLAGGGMPAFGGRLSTAQIGAVATYVSSAAGKGGPAGGAPSVGGAP